MVLTPLLTVGIYSCECNTCTVYNVMYSYGLCGQNLLFLGGQTILSVYVCVTDNMNAVTDIVNAETLPSSPLFFSHSNS
ncbi:hypothetical protein BDB01DRAFT_802294 [Pilobolus umbonatus]|nr:hypothetical protein BDB01DRAFT_802294 [Pilobolus umbonatus]